MFIGHYAAAFAIKATDSKLSLGLLFLAVQFVDILFFPLTLMGIERFSLIENYTESTHFNLEYMPYSHSLAAAFFWALLIFTLFNIKMSLNFMNKNKSALLLGLAILSHWFFDLIVHTPDLPLLTDTGHKLGFGLWNNALLTYLLEALFIIAGLIFYMRKTKRKTRLTIYGLPLFVIILLLINLINIFGPLSASDNAESVALSATFAYFVFAGLAHWLDINRKSVT